ncbi:MAG: hypothetical protein HQK65_02225 [Desulfamplus sp.]|nr:hypothetical protein [Desulfamplus sp.]
MRTYDSRVMPMKQESVSQIIGIKSIREVGVARGINEGWRWLTEQLNTVEINNG